MSDKKQKKSVKDKCAEIKKALWDSENKLFFGRSRINWLKLLLFYMVFYSCLALFFSAMMAAFYATVDDHEPKLKGKSSRLKDTPSLGFRPTPNYKTTLITFRPNEPSDSDHYVNNIKVFLDDYEAKNIKGETKTCSNGDGPTKQEACEIKTSDFLQSPCTQAEYYGYRAGTPCVLLRLNKIYGWTPELEGNGSSIRVDCHGENPADIENLGEPKYIPADGWPAYYFPYYNQEAYRSPLVMVAFPNLVKGVAIMVECRAYAKNIKYDFQRRLGVAHFELLLKH